MQAQHIRGVDKDKADALSRLAEAGNKYSWVEELVNMEEIHEEGYRLNF